MGHIHIIQQISHIRKETVQPTENCKIYITSPTFLGPLFIQSIILALDLILVLFLVILEMPTQALTKYNILYSR